MKQIKENIDFVSRSLDQLSDEQKVMYASQKVELNQRLNILSIALIDLNIALESVQRAEKTIEELKQIK